MALPPVKITLSVGGIAEAQSAIKTLAQSLRDLDAQQSAGAKKAAVDRSNAAKQAAQAEKQAAKEAAQAAKEAAKEAVKAAKDVAAQKRAAAKAAEVAARYQTRDLESARKERAQSSAKFYGKMNDISAGAAASFIGNVGAAAFTKMLGTATDALKQFAGFILHDVVKPGLKSNMAAQQLVNRVGGFTVDQFQGAKSALSQTYAFDQETVEKTLTDAIGNTGNFGSGKDVANLALKLGQAFGRDPTKLAALLANQRAMVPNMSLANFETMATHQMRKINTIAGSKYDEAGLIQTGGRVGRMAMQMTTRGADGKVNEDAIGYNVVALTGLLAKASSMGNTADEAADKLEGFMNDMKKSGRKFGLSSDGSTLNRSIGDAIGVVMAKSGGKFDQMMQLGFSESSVKLMEMLTKDGQNLSDIYRTAEGKKTGSGASAVAEFVNSIGKPSGANTADEEASAVRKTGWAQMTIAMNGFMATMQEKLVPVFEKKIIPALMKAEPQFIKIAESIADIIAQLAETDIESVVKTVVKAMATFGYYLFDFINTIMPNKINKKAISSLGKMAGIEGLNSNEDFDSFVKAEKMLHPEKWGMQFTKDGMFNLPKAGVMEDLRKRWEDQQSKKPWEDENLANASGDTSKIEAERDARTKMAEEYRKQGMSAKEIVEALNKNTDALNTGKPPLQSPARSGLPQTARPPVG